MCKCKLYNAAILFIVFLVGIGVAVMALFGLFPGLYNVIVFGICISVLIILILLHGAITSCKCMDSSCKRCMRNELTFAMCMAISALLSGLLALALYGGLCLFTAIVVGFGAIFFVAMLASLVVLAKCLVNDRDDYDC